MKILVMIMLILSSCENKHSRNVNIEPDEPLTMDSLAADTTKILVAELPIYFDSTDFLIHPIGLIPLSERDGKWILKMGSYSNDNYSNNGFSVDYYRQDYFSGSVINLVFEELKTRKKTLLTDKALKISYVQYLRDLSKKIKRHYIFYSVIDLDTNLDGDLNYQDISSLYISKIDGSSFKKVTDDFQEYDGGQLIIQDLKYYFRTIEDIDKDGNFTKIDKYHYYYIDFENDDYKINEYNPLELIMK